VPSFQSGVLPLPGHIVSTESAAKKRTRVGQRESSSRGLVCFDRDFPKMTQPPFKPSSIADGCHRLTGERQRESHFSEGVVDPLERAGRPHAGEDGQSAIPHAAASARRVGNAGARAAEPAQRREPLLRPAVPLQEDVLAALGSARQGAQSGGCDDGPAPAAELARAGGKERRDGSGPPPRRWHCCCRCARGAHASSSSGSRRRSGAGRLPPSAGPSAPLARHGASARGSGGPLARPRGWPRPPPVCAAAAFPPPRGNGSSPAAAAAAPRHASEEGGRRSCGGRTPLRRRSRGGRISRNHAPRSAPQRL